MPSAPMPVTAEPGATPPKDVQRVQVLHRAVLLLRTIAREPQPLNAFELARRCGLNRTTAWRILVTLEHNELVERDAADAIARRLAGARA